MRKLNWMHIALLCLNILLIISPFLIEFISRRSYYAAVLLFLVPILLLFGIKQLKTNRVSRKVRT